MTRTAGDTSRHREVSSDPIPPPGHDPSAGPGALESSLPVIGRGWSLLPLGRVFPQPATGWGACMWKKLLSAAYGCFLHIVVLRLVSLQRGRQILLHLDCVVAITPRRPYFKQ